MIPYDIGRIAAYAVRPLAPLANRRCRPDRVQTIVEEYGIMPWGVLTSDIIAEILATENVRSVHHCYGQTDDPEAKAEAVGFIAECRQEGRRPWTDNDKADHPLGHIIGSLKCYSYQSCEHPDWLKSAAFNLYELIISDVLEDAAVQLGGFQWGGLEDFSLKGEFDRIRRRRELQEQISNA